MGLRLKEGTLRVLKNEYRVPCKPCIALSPTEKPNKNHINHIKLARLLLQKQFVGNDSKDEEIPKMTKSTGKK